MTKLYRKRYSKQKTKWKWKKDWPHRISVFSAANKDTTVFLREEEFQPNRYKLWIFFLLPNVCSSRLPVVCTWISYHSGIVHELTRVVIHLVNATSHISQMLQAGRLFSGVIRDIQYIIFLPKAIFSLQLKLLCSWL